jgi:hypothetical protein
VTSRREPVSIVTVFNDPDMRRECLDRSIERSREEAPETEYVPVDNVGGAFSSAGAALNHGASIARHDYVAFVHQDVYLNSLAALERAAGRLAEAPEIGLLGAIGVTPEGRYFGRVRDRVFLLGERADAPTAVDSVDELLFLIPRRMLAEEPLLEAPELAWHAYAVEYGLRMRARGMRVCAVDIPVTHNSLSVNVDRLEAAYAALAARYPDAMPVHTPQGVVEQGGRARDQRRFLAEHRWRYRWLRESVDAHKGSRAAGGSPCVLGDIRQDVDELLAALPPDPPLLAVNADAPGGFGEERPGPLALPRNGRLIELTSRPAAELPAALAALPRRPMLVTNLGLEDVRAVSRAVPERRRVLGYRTSLAYWMLLDVPSQALPAPWRSRRATPLGMSASAL